jgi:hypothetical protein
MSQQGCSDVQRQLLSSKGLKRLLAFQDDSQDYDCIDSESECGTESERECHVQRRIDARERFSLVIAHCDA